MNPLQVSIPAQPQPYLTNNIGRSGLRAAIGSDIAAETRLLPRQEATMEFLAAGMGAPIMLLPALFRLGNWIDQKIHRKETNEPIAWREKNNNLYIKVREQIKKEKDPLKIAKFLLAELLSWKALSENRYPDTENAQKARGSLAAFIKTLEGKISENKLTGSKLETLAADTNSAAYHLREAERCLQNYNNFMDTCTEKIHSESTVPNINEWIGEQLELDPQLGRSLPIAAQLSELKERLSSQDKPIPKGALYNMVRDIIIDGVKTLAESGETMAEAVIAQGVKMADEGRSAQEVADHIENNRAGLQRLEPLSKLRENLRQLNFATHGSESMFHTILHDFYGNRLHHFLRYGPYLKDNPTELDVFWRSFSKLNPALDKMVGQIYGMLGPLAKKHGVELKLEMPRGQEFILANHVDLKSVANVLMNLIKNAITYNKENGIVFVKIDPPNRQIMVGDTGIGMHQEFLSTYGDEQKQEGRKFVEGSSGQGSVNVAENIKRLGWELLPVSEVDKGSKFFIDIPEKDLFTPVTIVDKFARLMGMTGAALLKTLEDSGNYFDDHDHPALMLKTIYNSNSCVALTAGAIKLFKGVPRTELATHSTPHEKHCCHHVCLLIKGGRLFAIDSDLGMIVSLNLPDIYEPAHEGLPDQRLIPVEDWLQGMKWSLYHRDKYHSKLQLSLKFSDVEFNSIIESADGLAID